MICTFFGHRNCPENNKNVIKTILIDLIENKSVNMFYVGNHGNFDDMVIRILMELVEVYSFINFNIVLAYMPKLKEEVEKEDYKYTIYPKGA